MLRLTRRTEYGLLALGFLASHPGGYRSVREIVSRLGMPRRLLAEILKDLSHAQLVDAVRGPGGGYQLARSPKEITLAEIVAVLEGPMVLTECSNGGACGLEPVCMIQSGISQVARSIQEILESFTLEQLSGPRAPLLQTPAPVPSTTG